MNKLVITYYLEKHLNCAETMLAIANNDFNLGLKETDYRIMAGFGGGMFEEDICGVVTGGIAVLSLIFIDKSLLEKNVCEFKKQVKENLSSLDCRNIKPIYREVATGCARTIDIAYSILKKQIIINKKK